MPTFREILQLADFNADFPIDAVRLAAPVGEHATGPLTAGLALPKVPLELLDQTLSLTAQTALEVGLLGGAKPSNVFAEGEAWSSAAGVNYAHLALDARLLLSGKAPVKTGGMTLTVGGSFEGRLEYDLWLPARKTDSLGKVLAGLVERSSIPQRALLDPASVEAGEVHALSTLLAIDLNVEAAGGGGLDILGDLSPDTDWPLPFKAHVEYALKASLGLSLYDQFRLVVGRQATAPRAGWVRVRLESERKRRLLLAASLAVEVDYDLASGLEGLIDQVFDLLPLPQAMSAIQHLEALRAAANGDWESVRAALTDEAKQVIADLIDDQGWIERLDDSPAVRNLVESAAAVVAAYDGLDARVRMLSARLVAKADLDRWKEKLEAIASFDPAAELRDWLDDIQAAELAVAFEALTGQSVEELVLAPVPAEYVTRARAIAQQALEFVETLENAPGELLERLDALAGASGIKSYLDWLRDNATSVPRLKAAADARLQRLIERLVGKSWDRITATSLGASGLDRLRSFADNLFRILDAPEATRARLKKLAAKAKGKVGLSIGIELERLCDSSALVDVELDPADQRCRKAMENLARGSVRDFLAGLPSGGDESESEEDDVTFVLRECVLTSRRVRASGLSLLLPLVGWQKTRRQRIIEERVTVSGSGASARRWGRYLAAWHGSDERESGSTMVGLWATLGGSAAGTDVAQDYDSMEPEELRVTIAREDPKTTKEELTALGVLFRDLGFVEDPSDLAGRFDPGSPTRVAIDLRLPGGALPFFFDRDPGWSSDYLNAAHRWFDEELVPLQKQPFSKGWALARMLEDPKVRTALQGGAKPLGIYLNQNPRVVLGSRTFTLPIEKSGTTTSGFDWKAFEVLPNLASQHGLAGTAFAKSSVAVARAVTAKTPADAERASEAMARSLARACPHFWTPYFTVWLVLARLSRIQPSLLSEAKGVATVRSKLASGDWGEPISLALDAARLPKSIDVLGIFPIA